MAGRQIGIFFLFVLAGLAAGLLYTLTHFFARSKTVRLVCDLLYAAIASAGLFCLNLYANDGRADFYTLLGVAVGVLIYCKTFTSYLDKALVRLYNKRTTLKEEECKCSEAKRRRL